MPEEDKKSENVTFEISKELKIEEFEHSDPCLTKPETKTIRHDYSFPVEGRLVYARDICNGPPGGVAEECKPCGFYLATLVKEVRRIAVDPKSYVPRHVQIVKLKRKFTAQDKELLLEGQELASILDGDESNKWKVGVTKFVRGWEKRELVEKNKTQYFPVSELDLIAYVPVPTENYGEFGLIFSSSPSESLEAERSRGSRGRIIYDAVLTKGEKAISIISNEADLPRHVYTRVAEILEYLKARGSEA